MNAIEHTTPPDAGVWSAKTIASKTSSERAHMDVLVDVLREAKAKGPARCTFMEGGEPTGLRFDRADGAKFWVYGAHGYAQKGDCYRIDPANAEKLRALAKTLGVNEPS